MVYIENVAKDLEAFAKYTFVYLATLVLRPRASSLIRLGTNLYIGKHSHASRTTITTDDVLLLVRRNEDLESLMKEFVDREKEKRATEASGKRKR